MTYEDPQALGGLASALDVRQQNTAGVSWGNACWDMQSVSRFWSGQSAVPTVVHLGFAGVGVEGSLHVRRPSCGLTSYSTQEYSRKLKL